MAKDEWMAWIAVGGADYMGTLASVTLHPVAHNAAADKIATCADERRVGRLGQRVGGVLLADVGDDRGHGGRLR